MDQLSWEVKYQAQKAKVYLLMTMSYMVASWGAPSRAVNVTCWAACPPPQGRQQVAVEGTFPGACVYFPSVSAVFLLTPNPSSDHWQQQPSPLTGHPGTCFKLRCCLFLWYVISHWKNIYFPIMPVSYLDTHCHLKLTNIPPGQKQNAIKKLKSIDSCTTCAIKHLKNIDPIIFQCP